MLVLPLTSIWVGRSIGESASYYIQGGASYVSPDGGDADTVPSGKAGISLAATEALGVYGEVSFIGSGGKNIDRGSVLNWV